MSRFYAASLTALVIAVLGVTTASASTILDPIVRTRGGGTGSYLIRGLPYSFNFGTFPDDPDLLQENIDRDNGENCDVGTDSGTGLTKVTCEFRNLTGGNISLIDFNFNIPGGGGGLDFTAEDPDGVWSVHTADAFGAHFAGGGLAPFSCGEIGSFCNTGDFFIDLIGFPNGTTIDAVFATDAPEPASLVLLGTGLGLGAALISRRHRKSTRRHTS